MPKLRDEAALVESGSLKSEQSGNLTDIYGFADLPGGDHAAEWNPEVKPYWTLMMALIWVMERDLAWVRAFWDAYIDAAAGYWHPDKSEPGWPPRPTILTLMSNMADAEQFSRISSGDTRWLDVERSVDDLLDRLAKGDVKAFGSRKIGDPMCQIQPYEWPMLALHEDGTSLVNRGTGKRAYFHIHVDRPSLYDAYPPQNHTAKGGQTKPANGRYEAWLEAIRHKWPGGLPEFLTASQKNDAIWQAILESGLVSAKATQQPSDRTFARFLKHVEHRLPKKSTSPGPSQRPLPDARGAFPEQ